MKIEPVCRITITHEDVRKLAAEMERAICAIPTAHRHSIGLNAWWQLQGLLEDAVREMDAEDEDACPWCNGFGCGFNDDGVCGTEVERQAEKD